MSGTTLVDAILSGFDLERNDLERWIESFEEETFSDFHWAQGVTGSGYGNGCGAGQLAPIGLGGQGPGWGTLGGVLPVVVHASSPQIFFLE